MKRIIIAAIIFAAALAGSVFELVYISAKTDEYYKKVETADSLVTQQLFEEALQLCADTDKNWRKTAETVDTLLIHDYVDGIGTGIARMKAFLENGSPDQYFAESESVKKALASVKGSEYPTFENIL